MTASNKISHSTCTFRAQGAQAKQTDSVKPKEGVCLRSEVLAEVSKVNRGPTEGPEEGREGGRKESTLDPPGNKATMATFISPSQARAKGGRAQLSGRGVAGVRQQRERFQGQEGLQWYPLSASPDNSI